MTGRRDSWALATLVAVLMIAAQVASKAVRDGLFLEHFPVSRLPLVIVLAAGVSLLSALLVGNFLASFTPATAVPILFATNGLLFVVEATLVNWTPRYVAVAVYLHTAGFGGAVVSGFWSIVNERFDPYTAKRVVARVSAGATLGGLLGGLATWAASDASSWVLLAATGATSLVCAAGLLRLTKRTKVQAGDHAAPASEVAPVSELEPATKGFLTGARVLMEHGYPRSIAVVVFLLALSTGLIDFAFKDGVVDAGSGSLVGFFALFYTVVGLVTFAVQVFATRPFIQKFGVVPGVSLWPITAGVLTAVSLIAPNLATLTLLRGGAMVVENSLYRSGYELLYTPVRPAQKRSVKVLIDLGIDRFGTAAAGGLALLAVTFFAVNPEQPVASAERAVLGVSLVAAVLAFSVLVPLRKRYLASLADNLRRAVRVVDVTPSSPPTPDLAATFVDRFELWEPAPRSQLDRSPGPGYRTLAELRAQVRALARKKQEAHHRARLPSTLPPSTVARELIETPLRRRLLDGGARDTVLRQSAPALIGQLGDIALARRESVEVRLASLELLSSVPTARGVAALVAALYDPELRIRRGASLALLESCRRVPHLRPPKRLLAALAADELRRPARPLVLRSDFERGSPFMHDARGNEIAPSLELALLLLSIGGDVEELRLALIAITSHNARSRGTGLEYLDNLLPDGLRRRVLTLAESPELTRAQTRVPAAVLSDLAARFRSRELDLSGLREAFKRARRDDYERSSSRPIAH